MIGSSFHEKDLVSQVDRGAFSAKRGSLLGISLKWPLCSALDTGPMYSTQYMYWCLSVPFVCRYDYGYSLALALVSRVNNSYTPFVSARPRVYRRLLDLLTNLQHRANLAHVLYRSLCH